MKYYPPFTSSAGSSTFPHLADGTAGANNLKSATATNKSKWLVGMEDYEYTQRPEYSIVNVDGESITLKTYRHNSNGTSDLIDEFTITTDNILGGKHRNQGTQAQKPAIAAQPAGGTVTVDEEYPLTVQASVTDGGTLSYQWFGSTTAGNFNGTAIDGATSAAYAVPTTTAGTYYYYVVVTNTVTDEDDNVKTASVTSEAATVKVKQESGASLSMVITWKPTISGYGYVRGVNLEFDVKDEDGNIIPCSVPEAATKVPAEGGVDAVTNVTVECDGETYTGNIPAIPESEIKCSSCEYYFGKISGSSRTIKDVAEACNGLKTKGFNNGTSNGKDFGSEYGRYYHFTALDSISSGYSGTAYRIFINGAGFAGGTGTKRDFAYVKANFAEAPEGGWYMYADSSSQKQMFNVSGGTDYCKDGAVTEPEEPEPTDPAVTVVWEPQLGTYGWVKGETVKAAVKVDGKPADAKDVSITYNVESAKLPENGFAEGEVIAAVTYKGEVLGEFSSPAITDPKCSSCEYYFGKISGASRAIKDVAEACNSLKTDGFNDDKSNAAVFDRYYHFTALDSISSGYNSTSYRIFINGAGFAGGSTTSGSTITGTKQDFAYVKANFAEAPEGGWYMYVDSSSQKQMFDVSGGYDNCAGEGEPEPPVPPVTVNTNVETLGLQPGSDITELNFNWYSDDSKGSSTGSYVRFYNASNEDEIVSTATGAYGAAPSTTPGKTWHRVAIKDLVPGTKYQYSVSNDNNSWSEKYDYAAPEAGNTFTFAAISDVQLGGMSGVVTADLDNWKSVAAKLKNAGVNFIVHTGDQVDATGTLNTEYTAFFSPDELRSIPFAPLMGNHDSHSEFLTRYNLPNEQDRPDPASSANAAKMNTNNTVPSDFKGFDAGNYYYLHNNVLFVGLNTAYYPGSVAQAEPFITKYDNTIKAAKAANAGLYDFIVVYHHKSTQTIASHAADTDVEYYVQAGIEKIMTLNGVSLVLSGHDHINVRSKFLVWDDELKKSVPNEKTPHGYGNFEGDNTGTVYLTLSTASGMKYYAPYTSAGAEGTNYANMFKISNTFPYLVNGTVGRAKLSADNQLLGQEKYEYTQRPEYTIVSVEGSAMTLKTYRHNSDGTSGLLDEFTIKTENKPNIARFKATAPVSAIYKDGLKLKDIAIPTGYIWNDPDQTLDAVEGRTFTAKYTNMSGTYEGNITVSVAKAEGIFVTPDAVSATYSPTLTLGNIEPPTDDYKWNDPTAVLSAAENQTFAATYTDPSGNYTSVTGDITVNVAQAVGSFGTPDAVSATYSPTLTLGNIALPTDYKWNDPTTVLSAAENQTFAAIYTDPSGNYTSVIGDITVNVSKATGSFGTPTALSATYSPTLTLGNIEPPTDYVWNDPTTVLSAAENKTFAAIYTDPSGNYTSAIGDITVNVAQATGIFKTPDALSATYSPTLTLGDISLSTDYVWNDLTTSLNAAENQKFVATYTDPSGNYTSVTGDITVNIAQATGIFKTSDAISVTYTPTLTLDDILLSTDYAWNTPTTALSAAENQTFAATYTDPSGNYTSVVGDITVNVEKAAPSYTAPAGLTATYGDLLSSVTLTGGWSWEGSGTVGNAGTQTQKATFTPDDVANYNIVERIDVTVTVAKAVPAYDVPTGITATYGDLFSSVELPKGWSWEGIGTVGGAGTHTHKAAFTPDDAANYNIIMGINVTLTVAKADPKVTWPTGLGAKAGQTLEDVSLASFKNSGGTAGKFSWESPKTTPVGNAGENKHSVVFTPASANYKSVTESVTVAVGQSSVLTADRIIPAAPSEEAAVIAPVTVLSGEFTAGPNPVVKSLGSVNFYRQGKRVAACELYIYDATGNIINKVKISDKAFNTQSRRIVGNWDLTDSKGRQVSAGAYLVKGVLKTSDGKSEKASVILGVR